MVATIGQEQTAFILGVTVEVVMAGILASSIIEQIDTHIEKINNTENLDDKDPNKNPFKHWIQELKNFVKQARQQIKKLPNNKIKRKPIEEAIERGIKKLKTLGVVVVAEE